MKQPTIFEQVRASVGDQQRSFQWYQAQIAKLGNVSTSKLMQQGKLVSTLFPGNMYMFRYDPKMKDTLPYYDTFPLVLPFRRVQGGFIGINFHYLPYQTRLRMMRTVSEFTEDPKIDESTFVRVTWRLIESTAMLKPLRFCVKHYILEQVQSRFLKIPFTDWFIASQLPVERFEGANKKEVWRETRTKYGQL